MTYAKLGALGLAFAFALAIGCGGKQTSDPSPASGGAGASGGSGGSGTGGTTGGSGGTGASGSGGMGGSTICGGGNACAPEGAECVPPGCCQCSYTCVGGSWKVSACPGCVAPSCPASEPTEGTPCDECQDPVGTSCSYGACNDLASCDGKTWHVVPGPCPPPEPCGAGGTCLGGQLCVYPGGFGDMPFCADNPCDPNTPVSCICAGSLCSYGYCATTTAQAVYCECPNC